MFRHEFKVEYLCKFENSYSIGISNRGSHITQFYRYLLYRSRQLCQAKMRGHLISEERDFCGCVFAISFIREPHFQTHFVNSIQAGFVQWYTVTNQVNSYRGVHHSNLQKYHFNQPLMKRTMEVILKEVGLFNFKNPTLTSLEMYFARCHSINPSYFPGFLMSVKKKPSNVSLSGVMTSLAMRFHRGNSDRGTSTKFYENALKTVQPDSLPELVIQNTSLTRSDPSLIDVYNDFDLEEDQDSAARFYRRQSLLHKTPPLAHITPDLSELEPPPVGLQTDVIQCSPIASSNGSQFELDLNTKLNSEELLRFELLNPSIFFWKSIYDYISHHRSKQHWIDVEKEDWYSLLIHNGSVYIAFVNFYHQYISSVGKGDIVWSKLPGYAYISITIPIMMMECRFQNRSKNEMDSYIDFDASVLSTVYPATCFRLINVSKDTHPILESIRILPKFNPHLSYACLIAVFNSTNLILHKDVNAYLSRCKEIVKASYQARLSYYQNAKDLCTDECLISGVIEANELQRSPRSPADHSPAPRHSSPFSIHSIRSLFSSKSKITTSKSDSDLVVSIPNLEQPESFPVVSPGRARQASICTLRFQEQIESSLCNLSRISTLAAYQIRSILMGDHCGTLLYAISTVYDFQSILTDGDFHIFINTLLFDNTKYISRYGIENTSNRSPKALKLPSYPTLLARLFCHWGSNVCDYLHLLLVYRIILVNPSHYTDLQRLLISAFETTALQLKYNFLLYRGSHIIEEDFSMVDFCEVGRKMILLFQRNRAIQLLDQAKEDIQKHAYTDYPSRLAMELDVHLFSLFLQQYHSQYNFMYNEPNYSYMLSSLGRFAGLLYKVYFNPEMHKAPMVLNTVVSNIGNGA